MAVIYKCDVCKKKTKQPIFLGVINLSPFRHLCIKCWESTLEFLKEKAKTSPIIP